MKTLTITLGLTAFFSLSVMAQTGIKSKGSISIKNSTISGFSNPILVKGNPYYVGGNNSNNSFLITSKPQTLARLKNDTLWVNSDNLDALQKHFSSLMSTSETRFTIFFKVVVYNDGRKIVRPDGKVGRILFYKNSLLIEDK